MDRIAALLGRGGEAVQPALNEITGAVPFPLPGVNLDNGSEFINWHLRGWCQQRRIQLTRGRLYKKDDNAHMEPKNYKHVRRLLGLERYDSPAAVEAINDLYRNELRLWLKLLLSSVKLARKVCVGSKVRRRYEGPQTPLDRLRACAQDREKLAQLGQLRKSLDPFQLGEMTECKLDRIYKLANHRLSPMAAQETATEPLGHAGRGATDPTREPHEPEPECRASRVGRTPPSPLPSSQATPPLGPRASRPLP